LRSGNPAGAASHRRHSGDDKYETDNVWSAHLKEKRVGLFFNAIPVAKDNPNL